jgi:hypothetical protein
LSNTLSNFQTQTVVTVLEKLFNQNKTISNEVNYLDKKCPVCKQKFMTFDAKKKYCSDACTKKANKAK